MRTAPAQIYRPIFLWIQNDLDVKLRPYVFIDPRVTWTRERSSTQLPLTASSGLSQYVLLGGVDEKKSICIAVWHIDYSTYDLLG